MSESTVEYLEGEGLLGVVRSRVARAVSIDRVHADQGDHPPGFHEPPGEGDRVAAALAAVRPDDHVLEHQPRSAMLVSCTLVPSTSSGQEARSLSCSEVVRLTKRSRPLNLCAPITNRSTDSP